MKAIWFGHVPQRRLWAGVILGLFVLFCAVAPAPDLAYADNPSAVQIFYVSLPEADALTVLDAIHPDADPPMYTYFSIAVGFDNAYVYYDQWEDGYAADIANPTSAELYNSATNPAGVQIWGNGLAADGCAPNLDGVPLTCTNGNDVLHAGNVIIPYSIVEVPRVAVAQSYVQDTFATQSYSRNDGNTNWSTNWVETNDDGQPDSGDIRITNGVLRFRQTEANDSIYRGVSLPTGDACATLSFTLGQNAVDATGDNFAVQVSSDGGAHYTTLETYDSPSDAGSKSYPISAYATTNTRVRFISLDALETGEYWTVDNVRVEWNCSPPILFDARDKVGASDFISMARSVWATGSGTLNAYAHELYNTAEWGTTYESPVGTNSASPGNSMFQYSALTIMASQNNTQVQIDANADGTYETTVALQEGGSTLVTGIRQGARVVADKPVQVVLLTGDIGDTYESRDMSLLPVSIWGSSYWSPVGVMQAEYGAPGNPTRLWLYNLSTNSNIYITCERYGVANTTLGPVAPRGVVTIDLGANQGAHCYASNSTGTTKTGELFFGVGTIDTAGGDGGNADGSRSDWSITLYPEDFLTTDALVGLGLGKDPTDTTSTENGSPLWVTAACPSGSTYVYVDWDNDGTADPVDTNGDDVAEAGSQSGILVNRLQSVRLFEPGADEEEYDQSGARIWSRTASGVGYGGIAGCRLAMAWGQDPPNATAGAPGLDVGTSVPPMRLTEGTKSLALKTDADGDGLLSPGDTATYNMTIHNRMLATVANVYIYDQVPANTAYVAHSTQKNVGGGWVSIPDDGSGTPFPLDVTGGVLLGNMPSGATFYVRFDVTLNAVANYDELLNCDTAFAAGTFTRCAATFVASYDWGDLPDTYGTARAADGPRHSPSGLRLGSVFDHELQGQPTTGAVGDDTANSADEDGVALAGTTAEWWEGSGKFSVTVTGGPGCLNAWMDFTNDTGSGAGTTYADGNFTKTGGYDTYSTYSEYIIQNVLVSTGTSIVQVTVPPALNAQTTNPYYFRFRLSPLVGGQCTTGIAPSGLVAGGEVEDYQFKLENLATAVELLSFEATGREEFVEVSWETASETDNLGFNLYRATSVDGSRTRINAELIPTQVPPGSPFGAAYKYEDGTVVGNQTYYYWLEVVDIYGQSELYGPVEAQVEDNQSDLPDTSPVIELPLFEATGREGLVEVSWETASEIDNLGFNLYRATSLDGGRNRINGELIPTQVPPGSPFGAAYKYEDTMVEPGQAYYYWLEVADIYGQTELYGPVEAQVEDNQPDLPQPSPDVELLLFEAAGREGFVEVSWETASETDNLGFNLYRAASVDGSRTRINGELIPTQVPPGSPFGAAYKYEDTMVEPGQVYYYWLEVVDMYGQSELYGPVEAQVDDNQPDLSQPAADVELLLFEATGREGFVEVSWETASETDNLGFNLYRATSLDGERDQVNAELILTQVPPGGPFGAVYTYEDTMVEPDQTYYYWLEVVDIYGRTGLSEPVQATTVR